MIPDFVQQLCEIQACFGRQSEVVRTYWKDVVAEKYYACFVDKFEEKTQFYVQGGLEMTGMGLDDLLVFFDEKENELSELGPLDFSVSNVMNYEGKINNEYREREHWEWQRVENDEPDPSTLSGSEAREIEIQREQSSNFGGYCDRCHQPLFRCGCGERRNVKFD